MSATILVNGETQALTAATVAELLRQQAFDLSARGLAVAVNGAVARRRDWDATPLTPGDEVEIVKPFAGG